MTLDQFRQMNETEQLSAILEFGSLMAQNVEHEYRLFLYRLDSFYVSTRYEASTDMLADIVCYSDVSQDVPHFRKHLIAVNPAERTYNTPDI